MSKLRKLLSAVLVVTILATSVFVSAVTASAETLVSIANTYDDENTSYRTALSSGETRSYVTVDGVEEDWYCFSAWNASVEKDTTKTGNEQNAVQFLKAAKLEYKWPAAVRIYDNDFEHYKAKANTTYEITVKYYAVTAPDREILLQVRNTDTNNIHGEAVNDATKIVANKVVSITQATDGWVEATAQFTTGDTVGYLNLTLCSATATDASNVNVWVDDITLNECKKVTAHGYDGANKTLTVTADTTLADIDIPSRNSYVLEGIYSNSAYTNKLSSSDKLAPFDDIYYKWVKISKNSLYCGFENYTEQIEGISLDARVAAVVEDTYYAGKKSMKLTLADKGITAFELRDVNPFDILANIEYTISFAYKTSADATISIGLADAGNVTKTAEAVATVKATASDKWQTATVTVTLEKSSKQGYVLAMLVSVDNAAEVFVDDVKITYLGAGTSALDEIDFGFSAEDFPVLKIFQEAKNRQDNEEEGETEEETAPTVWNGTVAESFAGGSGTEADPYIIETAEQLALAITQSGTTSVTNAETGESETVNETYFGSFYKITKDIYLNDPNAKNWKSATGGSFSDVRSWYNWNNGSGQDFAGSIDGDGHTVYGLYAYAGGAINYRNHNVGAALIPKTVSGQTVEISNLAINNSYIRQRYFAGAFVGRATGTVKFENCLVGENVAIWGCSAGSFVGCANAKTVNVTNCVSLATYGGTGASDYQYGFVGDGIQTKLTVKNSYNANGPIASTTSTNYNTVFKFYNSYESVQGGRGGSQSVTTTIQVVSADNMKGKDALTNDSKMPNLALNTDGSANGTFVATDGYPMPKPFAPEPEVNEGETEEIVYDIWDGTTSEPKDSNSDGIIEITNGEELAYIISTHGGEGNKYILTNDIYLNDISKINWATGDIEVGYKYNSWYGYSTNFEGSIDGNGYTIHGLFYTDSAINAKKWEVYGYGLIPNVKQGDVVTITNLGIDHAYVHSDSGASAFVGCAGKNSATENYAEVTIENCYAGKDVTLISYSVGVFRASARGANTYIRNCYSLATIDAAGDYGLAAMSWQAPITIEGCYNANGTLATATATISNSYQTVAGKTSAVTNIENMQGSDVLTNSSKMPLLDSAVFTAKTKTFAEHDFYVYLPAGTVFEEETEASFYSELFIKLDTSKVLIDGEMQVGAYVKFAEEPDESKILVPAELKHFVRYGSKELLLINNPYYGVTMDVITEALAQNEDSVKYVFITDIHYVGGEDVPRTIATEKQIENLVEYVNKTDAIDFVAVGGDTIQGTQKKSTSLGFFKKAFEPFLNCNKPVVIVPGNHDDNSYAYNTKTFDGSWVITDKEWNDNIIDMYVNRETANGDVIDVAVSQDSKVANSKYFYYDLEDKKTRIVCLDAIDYEQSYGEDGLLTVDENGNVGLTVRDDSKAVTNYNRYYMATTYWGYGARQMEWLAEDALQAGDDWDYIFISHMGIDEDTNFNSGAEITWYGKNLREIIKAFQFKTPYANEELGISVDYTDTKGEILSYMYGHTHAQKNLYSEDIDLWQVNSDTAQIKDGYFDIMTANKTVINRYNIGYGYDETFVQTKNALSGDLNGDGIVDICDAVMLKNMSNNGEAASTKLDVNNDNTLVFSADIAALFYAILY